MMTREDLTRNVLEYNFNGTWSTHKEDLIESLREVVEDDLGGYIETWADNYEGSAIIEETEYPFHIELVGQRTYTMVFRGM